MPGGGSLETPEDYCCCAAICKTFLGWLSGHTERASHVRLFILPYRGNSPRSMSGSLAVGDVITYTKYIIFFCWSSVSCCMLCMCVCVVIPFILDASLRLLSVDIFAHQPGLRKANTLEGTE